MSRKILNLHRFIFFSLMMAIFLIIISAGLYLNTSFSSKKKSDFTPIIPSATPGYSGRSTYGNCITDGACIVSGCNGEICQSKAEETLSSICIAPDKPLPPQLGYQCKCFNNKCQWFK